MLYADPDINKYADVEGKPLFMFKRCPTQAPKEPNLADRTGLHSSPDRPEAVLLHQCDSPAGSRNSPSVEPASRRPDYDPEGPGQRRQ